MQGEMRAHKRLGQHFLRDRRIIAAIVELIDPAENEAILEIGPGRGALSTALLGKKPFLVALEKDIELAFILKGQCPTVHMVAMDALRFSWERLCGAPWKIVGNLPYNVASPIIWEMAARTTAFSRAVFMVQKEVALRLTAAPGGKTYGALSVWVQSFVAPRLAFNVAPGAFWPRPKVDSAVVLFEPLKEKLFFDSVKLAFLVKYCFQGRRKQLGNLLKSLINNDIINYLESCGHSLRSRPEELSPVQFQRLSLIIDSYRA